MTVIEPEQEGALARATSFDFTITFVGDLKGCLAIYELANGMTDVKARVDLRASGGTGLASLVVTITNQRRPGARVALDAMRVIVEQAEEVGILRN